MLRALMLATLLVMLPRSIAGQALGILHIKILLADAERKVTPVPHYALLISDNPTSAPPRRVQTALDGTADVRLRPGNYTVESDRPVAFHGRSYQWTQLVDIVQGRDTILELTVDNAEVEAAATSDSATSLEDDPAFLLPRWQDSVFALWTPTTRGSGFVIDASGLVVTNQRVVGSSTSVDVQVAATIKVAARVLVADPARNVAVLWIDPARLASVRPVSLGCADTAKPPATGQPIFAIGAPLHEPKGLESGKVTRVEPHALTSDVELAVGGAGGPAFVAGGRLAGITSIPDETREDSASRRRDTRVVPVIDACEMVASAQKKMIGAAPPASTLLPVEPARPFPAEALKEAAKHPAISLSAYQLTSSDFDVTFITPSLAYGVQNRREQLGGNGTSLPGAGQASMRPVLDFGIWSDYMADYPPVLLVRVTPKQVEGFWTTVARGAARTQGVGLPPITHVKSSFSRLRAFCGPTEVTPIHPFTLELRVSETQGFDEGLYAYDPGALGPPCGTVKLVLYSDKEPTKGDTRPVDPKLLQQIWQDFASYRDPTSGSGDRKPARLPVSQR